ncbi:hypothetical protein LJR030_003625 [Rhizobium sp. LjRoot30]|uniref:hypothetical protein n=1 Tax=Rhizobium sp. LjRoot30 TaxID=3342320 RepID=UPI003ECD3EB5
MYAWWETVKKKAIEHITTTLVTGALALVSLGAVAAWGAIKTWALVPLLPESAIVAFAGPCPVGWEPYRPATARIIVGAGDEFDQVYRHWEQQLQSGGVQKVELSAHPLLSHGGEAAHILTIAEMPSHAHEGNTGGGGLAMRYDSNPNGNAFGSGGHRFSQVEHTHPIASEGGNEAHQNMPPYIALHYCQRLRS